MKKHTSRIISMILSLAMLAAFVLAPLPVANAADTVTIYFDNSTKNWSEVAIYTWNDNGPCTGEWPGTVMTLVEGSTYSYEVPADAAKIIFNDNNNGQQTGDMDMPTDGKNLYNGSVWGVYGEEIEVVYILAGSEELCGSDWDPSDTANQLFDEDGDKVYHITYPEVAAGTYEFKVTDGSWSNSWGEYATTNNYVLKVSEASSVTIQFNSVEKHILVDMVPLEEPAEPGVTEPEEPEVTDPVVPADLEYCLVGYINGANYGCEEDYENIGEYIFVDGTLTATFAADSYIFVKSTDNSTWLLAETYCSETSCTFVKDAGEKMFVPGGVELTFTLVENEDGSVTVSYAVADGECAHDYVGGVTTEPGCVLEGTTTYTCSKCGAVYTESIPATGHTYEDTVVPPTCENNGYTVHTCTICGYHHSTDAVNPIGHDYISDVIAPTCTQSGYTLYTCLNCGNSYEWNSTAALGHTFVDGVCSTCGEADPDYTEEPVDYYLIGYINGADYGIGEDVENLGEYLFVDGKLTVSFTEDSYVAVKTGDNATFYMTNGYVGEATSATLYAFTDPNSASANKLLVSGGQTVNFTLTENWDGNLIISYTVDATACVHASHNTDGICATCGATVEHTFADGICSICGAADPDYVDYYDYYLYGYINGANYGFEEDSANLGDYKFVNGQLTVTFDADSYVGVKSVYPNGKYGPEVVAWYMTDGWLGTETTTATLYRSSELYGNGDKLFVPGGVELTFTMEVEGLTVILSYAASTCEHSYTEEVTTEATCTAEGVKTFTCSECGHTYTETIPAAGHSFVDGICSSCGAGDGIDAPATVTIYFDAAGSDWTEVNVYAWNGNGDCTGGWPGTAMTLVEGTVYSYEVPTEAAWIIFNGNGQTGDLEMPTDGKNLYTYATGIWSVYGEETPDVPDVPVTDTTYYIVGWINGANYGCEEDYENMGEYKFVDGKLTATFAEDSYIFLKTEGNGKWLMADAYTEDTTCTFAEGKTEKMKVPGGKQITFTLTENEDGSVTLSYTAAAIEPSVAPTLALKYPTVSFEDVIVMNVYYTAADLEDVVEMGLITYSSNVSEWNIENAEEVIPGYSYDTAKQMYVSSTNGIAAKNLGDTLYFAVYAKLADGTYAYTKLVSYSPETYAYAQLSSGTAEIKALVVAMLKYGAAAQTFFGHNTDALVDRNLTSAQLGLIESYRADMMNTVATPSTAKQGSFVANGGITRKYPTVSFEGAFEINYYCVPANTPVDGVTMYYWNQADYDAAEVLTAENATAAIKMDGTGTYQAAVKGIAAKDLDKGIYVAFVYSDGTTTYSSGVLAYSIGTYCNASVNGDVGELAKATAVYGYCAKLAFYGEA